MASSDLGSFANRERMAAERLAGRGSSDQDRAYAIRKDESKLRSIIQHFFSKAALAIVNSRCDLPPAFTRDGVEIKKDRWFNLVLPESDLIADAVIDWSRADIRPDKPPPAMIIEILLDTAELARNQTLVAVDERGRRWDVRETFSPSPGQDASKRKPTNVQVALERWRLSLGDPIPAAMSDPLPITYKKALVMFRCLMTFAMLRPAYKFFRNAGKQNPMLNTLRPTFRIFREDRQQKQSKDLLTTPLWPRGDPAVKSYRFDQTKTFLGSMSVECAYRRECEFVVDDSEALLSSRFRGLDDQYFKPSLGASADQEVSYLSTRGKEVGSLPTDRHPYRSQAEVFQAPASLSTFHRPGAQPGTSPISALRAARDLNSESPANSPPARRQALVRPGSASRSSQASGEGIPLPRRTSVSFQPFKAGSLSSSPAFTGQGSASNLTSGLSQARNRGYSTSTNPPSIQAPASPTTARPPPRPQLSAPVDIAVGSPGSLSPKAPPMTRFSSSFQHRKRWSSGGSGTHKYEEDATSSGKASQSSSKDPGSGLLNEAEGGATSASPAPTDDDNISDFLKLVDQNKDLKSFNRTDEAARDASVRRTNAALSKYQRLRESHTALTESLSSSLTLHRSSSSSSRQLSSVPPALAGNSVSTSSSPGKPISPHTPHTPAIPSRLSANAPITASTEDPAGAVLTRGRSASPDASSPGTTTTRTRTPGAIDIPTSPHRHPPHRRSSSAQRQRSRALEDEFGLRSASVPDDRPDLSLSELVRLHDPVVAVPAAPVVDAAARPFAVRQLSATNAGSSALDASSDGGERRSSASASVSGEAGSTSLPHHTRNASGSGSGSYSSLRPRLLSRGRGGSTGSSFERTGSGSRYSFSAARRDAAAATVSGGLGGDQTLQVDDEEPLLFTMSELETQNQRRDGEGSAQGMGSPRRGFRKTGW